MGGSWRSLKGSRKGFTLVETIVVFAIMTILLAVTGVNVVRYHRYAQWREQEEYARSLYLAAQTELAKRGREGRLSELEELFGPEDAMDFTGLIGADGQALAEEEVWASKKGKVYVLEVRGGSLQEQGQDLAGAGGEPWGYPREGGADRDKGAQEETEARKSRALYGLLSPYVPDKAILQEGAIRIELDPSAGLVYGVFYSSYHPGGFCCGEGAGELKADGPGSERGDITDRRAEARQAQMIGYHGVDTLSGAVDGKAEKPVIRSLRLEQHKAGENGAEAEKGGQLVLSWQVEAEDMDTWKELTYEVSLYGSFREDPELFKGEEGLGGEERREDRRGAGSPQKLCTVIMAPDLFEEDRLAGYPGIPSRFSSLDQNGGYAVMQAIVCQDGSAQWACFPVALDEASCRIWLVLDRWALPGTEDEKDGAGEEAGRASKSDSGRAGRLAGLAWWSEDALPWFSFREQVQEAGWELEQLEGASCTVVGYGGGHVDAWMKESNWEALKLSDGEAEDEDEREEESG